MFFIVNKVDGAETWEYHYSLITGMMQSNVFLSLVFFFWFLYARKCYAHTTFLLRKPEYGSIRIINSLSRFKQLRLFIITEAGLMLPVLLYAGLIIYIGFWKHYYVQTLLVILFLLILLVGASAGHLRELNNQGNKKTFLRSRLGLRTSLSNYPLIIIQYIFRHHKLTWLAIKLFTCGILYVVVRNNTLTERDIKALFLFYSFGIIANAIIIYKARKFEEVYVSFYRSLPVYSLKRLLQYALVVATLLVPEFATCYTLAPLYLPYHYAIGFSLSAFGLLLLLNSVTFIRAFNAKEFIKIAMIIFCMQYIIIMSAGFPALYLLLFVLSSWLFFINYLHFEPANEL